MVPHAKMLTSLTGDVPQCSSESNLFIPSFSGFQPHFLCRISRQGHGGQRETRRGHGRDREDHGSDEQSYGSSEVGRNDERVRDGQREDVHDRRNK